MSGTPLISDPGFIWCVNVVRQALKWCHYPVLVRQLRHYVHRASHLTVFALKVFYLRKPKRVRIKLENVAEEDRTLIFYESTHRILDTLADMQDVLGGDRYVVLAREITKTWETIAGDKLSSLRQWLSEDPNRTKGEMVFNRGRQTQIRR